MLVANRLAWSEIYALLLRVPCRHLTVRRRLRRHNNRPQALWWLRQEMPQGYAVPGWQLRLRGRRVRCAAVTLPGLYCGVALHRVRLLFKCLPSLAHFACKAPAAAATLRAGTSLCDGGCVDMKKDPKHCGGCGKRVAKGGTCQNGVSMCSAGEAFCASAAAHAGRSAAAAKGPGLGRCWHASPSASKSLPGSQL